MLKHGNKRKQFTARLLRVTGCQTFKDKKRFSSVYGSDSAPKTNQRNKNLKNQQKEPVKGSLYLQEKNCGKRNEDKMSSEASIKGGIEEKLDVDNTGNTTSEDTGHGKQSGKTLLKIPMKHFSSNIESRPSGTLQPQTFR